MNKVNLDVNTEQFKNLLIMAHKLGTDTRDSVPILTDEQKSMINTYLAMLKPEGISKHILAQPGPDISWNHAKILAVDGQTLLTGGANFWQEYSDDAPHVSDLQCKILGGASHTAHAYCNYL